MKIPNVGTVVRLATLGLMVTKGKRTSRLVGAALIRRELKKLSR